MAGVGQLGGEEVVVAVGEGVDGPVDRLGLVPPLQASGLDPRQLGQGVDDVGVGVGSDQGLERGEDGRRVAPVLRLQAESLEGLDGPIAGSIQP